MHVGMMYERPIKLRAVAPPIFPASVDLLVAKAYPHYLGIPFNMSCGGLHRREEVPLEEESTLVGGTLRQQPVLEDPPPNPSSDVHRVDADNVGPILAAAGPSATGVRGLINQAAHIHWRLRKHSQ